MATEMWARKLRLCNGEFKTYSLHLFVDPPTAGCGPPWVCGTECSRVCKQLFLMVLLTCVAELIQRGNSSNISVMINEHWFNTVFLGNVCQSDCIVLSLIYGYGCEIYWSLTRLTWTCERCSVSGRVTVTANQCRIKGGAAAPGPAVLGARSWWEW